MINDEDYRAAKDFLTKATVNGLSETAKKAIGEARTYINAGEYNDAKEAIKRAKSAVYWFY